MKNGFFVFCILLHGFIAAAQDSVLSVVRHLDMQSGLADHRVKFIYQDQRGLIWLNTANGLQWFNGNQFYTYSYDPQLPGQSLPSGIMNYGITEDREGNIWTVTEHEGPVKINRENGSVTSFHHSFQQREQLRTHTIIADSKHQLYVSGITGLYRLTNEAAEPVLPDNELRNDAARKNQRTLLPDRNGQLWIATAKGFLLFDGKQSWYYKEKNPKGKKLLNYNFNISAAYKDRDENIWFSSWDLPFENKRYLYKYDLRKNRIDSMMLPQPQTGANEFFSIPISLVQDKQGHLWVATLGGHLYVYNSSLQLLKDYSYLQWGEKRTRAESLYTLFCDADGNIWISSADGLFITTPAGNSFTNRISLVPQQFSMQDDNTTIMLSASGQAYLNNKGKGVFFWNKEANQLEHCRQTVVAGKWQQFQTLLTAHQNRMYFTPWFSDAVIYYDEPQKSFGQFLQGGNLHHLGVKAIAINNNLLLSGKYSIKRYTTNGRFTDSLQLGKLHTVITDWKTEGHHCLAIDTGATLYLLEVGKRFSEYRRISLQLRGSNFKIISTNRHYLIGTQYEGIKVYDKKGKAIQTLSTKDGLLSNSILNLFTDETNRIWIETPNGFNYISNSGKLQAYAIPQLNKRYNGFVSAKYDGHLGFYLLFNDRLEHIPYLSFEQPAARPFLFTAIQAGETMLPLTDNQKPVSLSWKNNSVSFEFAALDYIHAGSMQYRYRLNAIKEDWITAGSNNKAIFVNVKPGRYKLEIQYRHPNGNWQTPGLTYQFIIQLPFWKQWWFIALMLLAIAIPVYIVLLKEYRARKRIEEIRQQLSRDLHDDIGSTLSSIAVYSSVLENRLQAGKEKAIVTEIKEKATDSIQNMSDIVWAIQPENDSLQDFVQRFKAWAIPLLESSTTAFVVRGEIPGNSITLTMLQRRNLYLVCKEALNNCIKYADATTIEFSCALSGNTLHIRLKDDGKGFDEQQLQRRNGLLNMKHRMEELKGSLQIHSAPGKGCCITAQVPVS